ncbi:MAG: C40 family peptidase [Thiobacillaceae bacterium]
MKKLFAFLIATFSSFAYGNEPLVPTEVPMLALSLIGTPYRLGGNQPETGLDCSGLVNHVYLQAARLQLPRDTAALSQFGRAIEKSGLQAGDLVFFNTLDRAFSHVGIYLGDDRFIHASSSASGSVMLSSMTSPYWTEHFDGARRVLEPGASE